jgi:hypothetical protein
VRTCSPKAMGAFGLAMSALSVVACYPYDS